MIVQKNFLSKLRDFGLNTYESKLWTALLSRGISTAGELSDIAGVPRSRTYDVLESLEKKGFIVMKVGKPIKYIAFPPEEVIERVKNKIEEDAETKSMLLDELRASKVLDELNQLHKQGSDFVEATDLIGSFKGRRMVYTQLETMIKGAKQSVVIMTSAEGIKRKKDALLRAITKASERKVSVRIAAPITKDNVKEAKELAQYSEVRHTTHTARFCIIDGEKIMFMLLDDSAVDSAYDLGVWAETKPFLKTLQALFDGGWNDMKPLNQVKN